jgi:hypothetical protein
MKQLKMLGLSALAVTALAALAAAAPASATELYQRTLSGNVTLKAGTELKLSLTGSSLSTSTSGLALTTCAAGEMGGKTTTAGSSSTTVNMPIDKLTWANCTESFETVIVGELEFHHISGTTNATVTGKKAIWKENTTIFGAPCEYTWGEGLDLGTLTGAATSTGHATLAINAVVPAKNSIVCPDKRWQANYKVTSPTGLVVEAS